MGNTQPPTGGKPNLHAMKYFPTRLPALIGLTFVLAAFPAHGQQSPSGNAPILPDPKLTPGDTLDVTLADIQEKGYSAKVRNVPVAVKREVYAAYGIQHWTTGQYEIDHLVSLSLGGSNSKKNLWPQSYQTQPWNAHTKDQLEYKLLTLVRAGKVDLHTAQQEMAHDWIAAYKKYVSPVPRAGRAKGSFHPRGTAHDAGDVGGLRDEDPDTDTVPPGAATGAQPSPVATASGDQVVPVWVNTKSGVIWKPGSEFYGKTKEGKYMSASDALKAGYHYAR